MSDVRKLDPSIVAKCPCCGSDKYLWLGQCTDPRWYYVVCRNKNGKVPCSYHSSSALGQYNAILEWNQSLTF